MVVNSLDKNCDLILDLFSTSKLSLFCLSLTLADFFFFFIYSGTYDFNLRVLFVSRATAKTVTSEDQICGHVWR